MSGKNRRAFITLLGGAVAGRSRHAHRIPSRFYRIGVLEMSRRRRQSGSRRFL
jgi:hypothetical protein